MQVIVEDRIIDLNNASDSDDNDNCPININNKRRYQGLDMEDDDMVNDDKLM